MVFRIHLLIRIGQAELIEFVIQNFKYDSLPTEAGFPTAMARYVAHIVEAVIKVEDSVMST